MKIQPNDIHAEFVKPEQYKELWVTSEQGSSLGIFVNGDRGFLMFIRCEEDPGFTTRNPDYNGPDSALIEYRLKNGQIDEYPASWALPTKKLRKAVNEFLQSGTLPSGLTWHDDGQT